MSRWMSWPCRKEKGSEFIGHLLPLIGGLAQRRRSHLLSNHPLYARQFFLRSMPDGLQTTLVESLKLVIHTLHLAFAGDNDVELASQ